MNKEDSQQSQLNERMEVLIQPSSSWVSLQLDAVWQYRELLSLLVWRDIKVRYKQTALGVAWIVLQPILTMLIFSGIFGVLLNVPHGEIPYPLFAFAALLPWNYFASSFTKSSSSLVNSAHLITKVYFPRLIIPIAGVLSGLVDFIIGFFILVTIMLFYRIYPTPLVVLLPAFLLLAILTALGFSLWLSALNVRFRDINYLIPFFISIWLYMTPVIYPSTIVPERFRFLLGLNPMTGVVEGFRWVLFGSRLSDSHPPDYIFLLSIAITLLVLITGWIFFRRTERSFADII